MAKFAITISCLSVLDVKQVFADTFESNKNLIFHFISMMLMFWIWKKRKKKKVLKPLAYLAAN
jgi:hypothetical protein